MSWGMIGGAAVSVVGGSILGKGKSSQGQVSSQYSEEAQALGEKSAEVEQVEREQSGEAWKKFGEGQTKGQVFYDALGSQGADQISLWREKGLPILAGLAGQKIDATDRTAEQEGLSANAVKTQYGQARDDLRRNLEFARNPGDPGYADILGETYGREAADVAQAITNARLMERERLAGVEKENFARQKGVYDIYGNLLSQGINTTGAAGAGTGAIAGRYGNEATTLLSSANSAAARQATLSKQGYDAASAGAKANAGSAEKLGGAIGGIANKLIDKWGNSVDPTAGTKSAPGGYMGTGDYMSPGFNFEAAGYGNAFAEGGAVEGPGTGTSDSVTAIKKPGTYILSADTVRALGHKKLEDLMEKAGVRKSFKGGGGEESDNQGEAVRLSNGEWAMPPEVTKYHGEEFFNNLQKKFHRPVFADEGMANGGAIRKRRLPQAVEDAIFHGMPKRALGRRY